MVLSVYNPFSISLIYFTRLLITVDATIGIWFFKD